MWSFVFLCASVIIPILASSVDIRDFDKLNLQQWNSYKIEFNKKYESAEEDRLRMKIYLDHATKISEHNERFKKGEESYKLRINQFSDLTSDEFADRYLLREDYRMTFDDSHVITYEPSDETVLVPERKNWILEGAVTSVKSQGGCGSCWAFAAVAVLEGHLFIHNRGQKPVESLSPQNLVDCLVKNCSGYNEVYAFEYVKKHGLATESSYPYKGKQGACLDNPTFLCTKINATYEILSNDTEIIKMVVGLNGPITASMQASDEFIHFGGGGLFNGKGCPVQNKGHAVAIVGYDKTDDGTEYWIVKNSWGITWGEYGYVRVPMRNDVCGIETIQKLFPQI